MRFRDNWKLDNSPPDNSQPGQLSTKTIPHWGNSLPVQLSARTTFHFKPTSHRNKSQWGVVLVGSYPTGEYSWWGVILNSNSNLYSSIKGNFAWVLQVHVVFKMTSIFFYYIPTINHIYNHYEPFTIITY